MIVCHLPVLGTNTIRYVSDNVTYNMPVTCDNFSETVLSLANRLNDDEIILLGNTEYIKFIKNELEEANIKHYNLIDLKITLGEN